MTSRRECALKLLCGDLADFAARRSDGGQSRRDQFGKPEAIKAGDRHALGNLDAIALSPQQGADREVIIGEE
ncbi:MAG: hypothetical protein WDN46_08935 [Methylocella sp.]